MAKHSGNKGDFKNFLILFLICVVGIESYLLWNQKKFPFPLKRITATQAPKKEVPSRKVADKKVVPAKRPAPVVALPAVPVKGSGKIAFIIDDWGYTTHNCHFLEEISLPVTVSVLPSLAHTQDIIDCAYRNGKEIMLHLPLEPQNNTDEYPPDYIIKTSMGDKKMERIVNNVLDRMPHIVGVNNHMGSKATEDERTMAIVFTQLKKRGLFFVDSKVTAKSICWPLARKMGIPFTQRDIFLDNKNDREHITEQLNQLVQKAQKRGVAVAIGHDRELTLQVLKENIPLLKAQGYKIVTVKELINAP